MANDPNPTTKPESEIFIHLGGVKCDHDFKGWRMFDDGLGGETICTKCGMGAMEHTLRSDPT